jgi:hypothetical protein
MGLCAWHGSCFKGINITASHPARKEISMYQTDRNIPLYLSTALIAGLLAGSAAATESAATRAFCRDLIPIRGDLTWRDPGSDGGVDHCFEIISPEAGILMIDLATRDATAARSRLIPARTRKLGAPGEDAVVLKRSSTSLLVIFAAAGSYHLRVGAEDPWRPISPYKLQVTFLEPAGEIVKDGGEIEDEPDQLQIGIGVYDLASVSGELSAALAELCAQSEQDDHGGTPLCATAIGLDETLTGEIGNAWGDDEDVFRFHLAEQHTLEIQGDGETATLGELYDRYGNRLGEGDESTSLWIVRTLSPGTYFIRVTGKWHTSGPYSLTVRSSLR